MLTAVNKKKAMDLIGTALNNHGYRKVSWASGAATRYYSKSGTYLKIRVSDHVDPGRNDDVVADIILDGPTIMPDIEYRVKKAHEAFVLRIQRR